MKEDRRKKDDIVIRHVTSARKGEKFGVINWKTTGKAEEETLNKGVGFRGEQPHNLNPGAGKRREA